jgi:hypothetical protein
MPSRRKTSSSYKSTSARLDDLIGDVQKPHASINPPEISVPSDRDLRQKIFEINHCVKEGSVVLPPDHKQWFANAKHESVAVWRSFIERTYEAYGVFDLYWNFGKKNRKL